MAEDIFFFFFFFFFASAVHWSKKIGIWQAFRLDLVGIAMVMFNNRIRTDRRTDVQKDRRTYMVIIGHPRKSIFLIGWLFFGSCNFQISSAEIAKRVKKLNIVYAFVSRQHTVRLEHGSESMADSQSSIELMRVDYK